MPKTLTMILFATCLTMLYGCSTRPVAIPQTMPPFNPAYLQDCPQLPKLVSKLPSEERAHFYLTNLAYTECAARHHGLVEQAKAREQSK